MLRSELFSIEQLKRHAVTLAGQPPGAALVLTCEHASPAVPSEYDNLGLAAAQLRDHIGGEPPRISAKPRYEG